MIRTTIGRVVAAVAVALALAIPIPAAVLADSGPHDGSVVMQANVDLTVPEGTHRDAVIVVSADAAVLGAVETLVIFDGAATLSGAQVGTLVVIGGTADIGAGSTVDEVRTIDSVEHVAPGAVVGSQTSIEPAMIAAGLAPLAAAIWVSLALAYVLAGLVLAAIAGGQLRRAGASITEQPGSVTLGAIVILVGLPLLMAGMALTVVGIPSAIMVAIVVLPLVWFIGSVAVAVRIGDWIMLKVRGRIEARHPLVAAFLGTVVIGVLSIIPIVGFVIGLAGAGAVLLLAWSSASGAAPVGPVSTPQADPVAA